MPGVGLAWLAAGRRLIFPSGQGWALQGWARQGWARHCPARRWSAAGFLASYRSEEHTSELQSLTNLVCRLLLEKTYTVFFLMIRRPPRSTLFPYTRSSDLWARQGWARHCPARRWSAAGFLASY